MPHIYIEIVEDTTTHPDQTTFSGIRAEDIEEDN